MPDLFLQQPDKAGARRAEAGSTRTLRVAAAAKKTFGDEQKAVRWLERPTAALAGVSPMSLLGTDEGARQVEDLLARIDHGLAV